jgi:phosphopantothenoylcysteine synthetase/decarboxylase
MKAPASLTPMVDRLLVGVSGSISAMSIHHHLTMLRAAYARQVKVVVSYSAERFISPLALGHFCDELILASEAGDRSHMRLADWAQEYVLLPATAHVIGEIALGLAGSMLAGIWGGSPKTGRWVAGLCAPSAFVRLFAAMRVV